MSYALMKMYNYRCQVSFNMHNPLHSLSLTMVEELANWKEAKRNAVRHSKNITEQKCGFLVGEGSVPPEGQLEIVWTDTSTI